MLNYAPQKRKQFLLSTTMYGETVYIGTNNKLVTNPEKTIGFRTVKEINNKTNDLSYLYDNNSFITHNIIDLVSSTYSLINNSFL